MIPLKKIRSSQAARNAAASYLDFASIAICGLCSIPIAVRFLDKTELGLWAIVNGLISYLVWFDLGIGTASARMIAPSISERNQTEINRWWTLSRGIMFLLGCIGGGCCLLLFPLFFKLYDVPPELTHDARVLLVGAAVIVAVSIPIRGVSGLFTAQGRYHWSPLLQAITVWLNLLIFYLCLKSGLGLVSYVWAMMASLGLQWVAYWVLIRIGPMPPRWDAGGFEATRARSLMRYSLNIAGIGFVDTLSGRIPALMLGAVGGLGLVPLLHITMRAPTLVLGLVRKTLWSFYPGMLRMQVSAARADLPEKHRQVSGLVLAVGLIAAGGTAVFNKTFVIWLAGPSFYAGDTVTMVLVGLVIAEPLSWTYRILLNLSGDMGRSALLAFATLAVSSAAAYFAYRLVGMPGLLVVLLGQPVVLGFYGVFHGIKHCGHRVSDYSYRALVHAFLALVGALACYCAGQTLSFLPESITAANREWMMPSEGALLAGLALVAGGLVLGARCIRSFPGLFAPPRTVENKA